MIFALTSCSGLTPYSVILNSLPENEKLLLNNQWVHYTRQGAGESIILVHGFGASTFAWRDVQPVLAGQFDVVAVDLSGFGFTQRPVQRDRYSVAAQRDLVFAVMDALEIQSAHMVGHSYGGGVVMSAAVNQPQRVRSLVIVDSPISRGAPPGARLIGPLTPILAWYIENFALRPEWIEDTLKSATFNDAIVTQEMVDGYLERLEVEGLENALRGLSTARGGEITKEQIGRLALPTLVLWGRHDPVFPLASGQELAEILPNSELVIFEFSGHLPMEEEPAAFAEEIRKFISP